MLTLLQDKMDTPLGPLWVLCDEQFNLRAVEWDEHRDRMETLAAQHQPFIAIGVAGFHGTTS